MPEAGPKNMDEAKILFHTWSRPEFLWPKSGPKFFHGQNQGRNIFFSKLSNGLMVACGTLKCAISATSER